MQQQDTQHSKTEIADRRRRVAEMYLRGRYQTDIAEELGVNQATVSRDLAELRKEWLERSINHIDQKKAIELAKLDRLEVEYWDAWERSKQDAETTTTEREHITVKMGKGSEEKELPGAKNKARMQREGQVGNPAYLDGVMKCIQQRCKILGIEAPTKAELTGKDGKPIPVEILRGVSLDDL